MSINNSSDSEFCEESDSNSETISINPIEIKLKPSKLSTVTMANITLIELKTFSDVIPQYDGNIKLLSNFIKSVDEVYATTNTLSLSLIQRTYLFGIVKTKLVNKAAELLSENNFLDWEELKLYLTNNFTDRLTAETILLEILYCKFKINCETTLKIILEKFVQYKSKIFLTSYSLDQKNAIITEIQKVIVKHFISLLPTSIKGSFIVKNPETLEQCELLLRNEFNFINQNSHISPSVKTNNKLPPRKFPANNFPSQPINLKQNFNKNNTPFAPRQNIKNAAQNKQFSHQPMSTQTRSTQPMSFQTIRQNYNIEPDEFINDDEEDEKYESEEQKIDSNNDFLDLDPTIQESIT